MDVPAGYTLFPRHEQYGKAGVHGREEGMLNIVTTLALSAN